MRQIISISLISIHLLGNTELGQFMKLPQLISHYQTHHENNPSLSFFTFLVMHYAGDDGTSADDNDDMQLPCHDYHHTAISSVFASISFLEISHDQLWYSRGIVLGGCLTAHIPSGPIFSILQPPRKSVG